MVLLKFIVLLVVAQSSVCVMDPQTDT